jgi:hypothetical protein
MKTIYLISPYSSDKENLRWARAEEAAWVTAKLMANEEAAVFSPVAHGHYIHSHIPEPLRHSHDFWLRRDLELLRRFDEVALLPLSGWRESRGVQRELNFALGEQMPLILVTPFLAQAWKYESLTREEMGRLQPYRTVLLPP